MSEEEVSSHWQCPACEGEVEVVAGESAQLVHCPHCGGAFVVAGADGSVDPPEEVDEHYEKSWASELSNLRIQAVAKEKRALIRHQTYCITGAGGCVVLAIQLLIDAMWRFIYHDGIVRGISYILFAGVFAGLAWRLSWMAVDFYRKSRQELIGEPETPPDFSTLSDGSQIGRNLEDMQE